MKKIVLMLAAVLAVSSVSAFANNHEAKKEKKEHAACHEGKDAHGKPCTETKHEEKAAH